MLGRTRNRPRSLTLTYASLPLLAFAAALLPAVVANAHAHQRRDFRPLSDAQVRAVAELDPPPWDAVDSGHMGKLLVERVAGTKNLTEVQKYISGVFGKLGWHEEQVEHTEKTPIGDVRFNNLIYTFDPAAPRRLVLSAHIDSKWFPQGGFIGATDSAAPCGTMIDVAEALTPLLSGRAERLKAGKPVLTADVDEHEAAETTLQIVFFDGEEAFHQWSATDSVYGSRHLAQVWDETYLPDDHALARRRMAPRPTVLDTIDVLVLLDLMGTPKPRFYSYFRETDWMFDELAAADKRLRTAKLVKGTDTWFNPQRANPAGIEDDHIPFLHRGVDCLHLIPSPFPSVWHRMSDNKDALDLDTLRRWNTIMRVWTAGYLHLAPDDPPADADRAQDRRDELVRE